MDPTPALAASVGIALTIAASGIAFVSCGLAIRGAARERLATIACYDGCRDIERLNRWIGDRVTALGIAGIAASAASFAWGDLAVPLLGLFTVVVALVVALVAAGPPRLAQVDADPASAAPSSGLRPARGVGLLEE
jgi:hypothetical protein